jgi:hypothetical protein
VTIAANRTTEVAPSIVVVECRGADAAARTQEPALRCQMRTLEQPELRTHHVLPPPVGEKPMLLTRDQLGAIVERHLPCRLDARPLVEHLRLHESPVFADPPRPVDGVTDLDVRDPLRAAVCHQNQCLGADTVGTSMTASPVRVDGPAERHARLLGDAVEHRLGVHLVKTHVERLGCLEAAHRRRIPVAGQLPLAETGMLAIGERLPASVLSVEREIAPAHERMFA